MRVSSEHARLERVLVTGGAGFIGCHLCEELVKAGDSVVAVDGYSAGKARNLDAVRGRGC